MKLLNTDYAGSVAEVVLEALDETGYLDADEAIPGLVQAIVKLANGDTDLLIEAGDLLADGGVE